MCFYHQAASSILILFLSVILISSKTLECPAGSVITNNTCGSVQYIEGCLQYQNLTHCKTCNPNYVLKDSICLFRKSQQPSCLEFDYNGECRKCKMGLYLDFQSKECLDVKIAGCLQMSQNQKSCLNCGKNFQLYDGNCIPKIKGCLKYQISPQNSQQYRCTQCQSEYDLTHGECGWTSWNQIIQQECIAPFQKINGQCIISNCKHAFEWGCIQCQQNFDLTSKFTCIKRTIPGCIDYAAKEGCKLCQDAFYQRINGICYPFGCQQLNQNYQCNSCKHPFQLFQGHCKIQGCAYHGPNGCAICQPGTQLSQGRCIVPSQTQVACVSCPMTHYINQAGDCQKRQEGCSLYQNGKCAQCTNNYIWNTILQICVKRLPGCLYNQGSSKCRGCSSHFIYDSNKQICILPGCRQYSENGKCISCLEQFQLSQQGICFIINCLQFSQNGCIKCQEGYKANQHGQCVAFDPQCIARNIYETCIGCQQGFYLNKASKCMKADLGCNYVDGHCTSCKTPFTYNPQTSSCLIDGCKAYFFGGCEKCHEQLGYSLRYNSCKLPHCLTSNNGKCIQCDPDYIMRTTTSQCINKDEFCYEYNPEGQCIECAPKYFMSKLQHKCLQRQPGCIYDDQDRCTSCSQPFQSVYGKNKCYIVGCLQHELNSCKKCGYPFNLIQSGICQINKCLSTDDQKCLKCQVGYLLENGLCTTGDERCTQYNFTSGECLRCKQGYKVVQNRCQYGDSHCAQFTTQGHCANCQNLYFLNPLKQCEMRDPNCQQYTNGYCTKCKPYHFYFNSLCYQNSQGCLTQCNIDQCQKCEQGFELRDGKCHKAIKRLSWNDFDMGWSSFNKETEKNIFTTGKKNKQNLKACLQSGYGQAFFSSAINQITDFGIDSITGWQPRGDVGEFFGVQTHQKQTFYALDIKCLNQNSMTSYTIQYSEDLRFFRRADTANLACSNTGQVHTVYFTPVEALAVRIRVRRGKPHIAIDFFFNNKNYTEVSSNHGQPSIIQKTIRQSIAVSHQLLADTCKDQELCWFGLELCQPRKINGFKIINQNIESLVEKAYVDYSVDGVTFTCFMECKQFSIRGLNQITFQKPVFGSKMRVHVTSYKGQPKLKVSFSYN